MFNLFKIYNDTCPYNSSNYDIKYDSSFGIDHKYSYGTVFRNNATGELYEVTEIRGFAIGNSTCAKGKCISNPDLPDLEYTDFGSARTIVRPVYSNIYKLNQWWSNLSLFEAFKYNLKYKFFKPVLWDLLILFIIACCIALPCKGGIACLVSTALFLGFIAFLRYAGVQSGLFN